jgi:hypothetical protein
MTMDMATGSFKSTSGSVSVALVVLLVTVMVSKTSAQLLNISYVNELDAPVTVMVPATELGSSATATIAARSDGTRVVFASASLLANFNFEVRGCVYTTAGSIQGRATAITGTVKVYFTGHCATGLTGLQYLMTIEGDVVTTLLCAVPVNSNCTGPIS